MHTAYNNYKKRTGNDPFVYAIDIQGYGTKDVKGSKVRHITGWSDRLLDFIGQAERGDELVDYIEAFEIPVQKNPLPKLTKSQKRRVEVIQNAAKKVIKRKVASNKKKSTIKKRSAR